MKRSSCLALVLPLLLTFPGLADAAPPNDNFSAAINLGSGVTAADTGTADEASIEQDEPFIRYEDTFMFDYVGATVWWKWTCPAGTERLVNITTAGSTEEGFDEITFDTIQKPMDTLLMIFTGDTLPSLVPVAESNDIAAGVTSEVSFVAVPGTTYHIRVDSENIFPMVSTVRVNLTSQGTPTTADAHVAWAKARMTYTGDWNLDVSAPGIPVLSSTALNQASVHLQSALVLSKSHPEANALQALITLLKLQKETEFQALLTQLGIVDNSLDPELPRYDLGEDQGGNKQFSATATSMQVIDYGKTIVRPRLTAALAMLEKITSTAFLATLPDHMRIEGSHYVDYGDVLMLRGGFKVLLAILDLAETYQLAAPLQDMKSLDDLGMLDAQHAADLLGGLLKFTGTDKRPGIKTSLQAAIKLYNDASTYIRTKRPLARDEHHLFPLRGDPEEEADVRAQLDRINKSLGGTTIIENGWSINLGKLLSGTTSLRDLTPNFKGNKIIKGSVLKPDLAGVLPGASVLKVENFLRDEGGLWEDLIEFGTLVAPGQETSGTVNQPAGLFLPGTSHTISATPALGYVFAGWKFNDEIISPLSPYTFPVIREYTLLAHFAEDNRDDDKDGLSNFNEVVLGTNRNSVDSDGDGWPDGLDDSPTDASPRAFMVSQNFGSISLDLPVGTITAVKNLPAGVTYDAKNQRLVGRPNFLGTTVTTAKTFVLVATVKPASGPAFTLNLTFTVAPLPQAFFGSFHGLVERGALNDNLGGSVKLDVTNGGAVSGKIIMAGVTYTLPSKLRLETSVSPAPQAVLVVPALKPVKTLPAVHFRFMIDPLTGAVAGSASHSATPGEPGQLDFVAHKQVAPAVVAVGSYNSHLTPSNNMGDIAYPQGTGYSILKVSATGAATWTGKLADGSVITGAAGIGAQGQVPLHLMLYKNLGSVQGWSTVSAGRHTDSDPLSWVKKPIVTATRSYKDGFPTTLGLSLNGSLYNPKSSPFVILGLTAGTANARCLLTGANLGATIEQGFGVVAPATVKLITAQNTHKLALGITAATGIFKGSITPTPPGRKAGLEGIIVPHLQSGAGFFLLPESTLSTSALLSGRAVINAVPAP